MVAASTPLDLVERPSGLIEPHRWHQARTRLRDLLYVTSSTYLEARLGRHSTGRVDVLVGIDRARRQALHHWLDGEGESLDGIRRLLRAWREQSTGLSALWLEYDDTEASGFVSMPSVCACLLSSYDPHTDAAVLPRNSPAQMLAIIEAVQGRPASTRARTRVERCVAALPSRGRFIHLSLMLGRSPGALKLYGVVPRDQLIGMLIELGWRGPLATMQALLDCHCPPERVGDELYVDLTLDDLDAPGGNCIGLGFTPQHLVRAVECDPSRAPLLAAAEQADLCTAQQRRALELWPARSMTTWEHDGCEHPVVVDRWLDLKLVWHPSRALELKAYLGLCVRGATAFDQVEWNPSGRTEPRQVAAGQLREPYAPH